MLQTQPMVQVNEATIPALGLGTWQVTGPACAAVVEEALHRGYRHIDTAQAYDNEDRVGEGMSQARVERQDIFLTTKVWFENYEPRHFKASVDESLRKLNTDYVDLLLLHWPRFETLSMETVLDSLVEVKEAGKAVHIGVSNFTIPQIDRAQKHTGGLLVANQVEYHLLLDQSALLAKLLEQNMALTAYSPLARGRALQHETVLEIAQAHGIDPAQVAIAWLLSQQNVVAIPKASTAEHLRSNLVALEVKLSDEELTRLNRIPTKDGRQIDPSFAPRWD